MIFAIKLLCVNLPSEIKVADEKIINHNICQLQSMRHWPDNSTY